MPQTDTPAAPAPMSEAGTVQSRSDTSGSAPGVRAFLCEAADIVNRADARKAAGDIAKQRDDLVAKLLPVPDPDQKDDPCLHPGQAQGPRIPGFCLVRQQALDEAGYTYTAAVEDAQTMLEAAKRIWARALGTYDFAIRTAENTLQASVSMAADAYEAKINQDSSSRRNVLFHTMKQAIAAAAAAFEDAASSAGAALAGATGTLIIAYQTYLAAIGAAVEARATAMATFWGEFEGVLDS